MSINKIKELQEQKGFTIVELLIVIVVIGILAAIVIVAFNGVQNQAKGTQYKTDAASITKVAEAYNADETTSGYPTTAAAVHGVTSVQLPSNVRLAATAVTTAPASTAGSTNPTIASGVKTYNWKSCGSAGLVVYYVDPTGPTTKSAVAGVCTP